MRPSEIKVGDVISKPSFWTCPMVVTNLWDDGDSRYADVMRSDGVPMPINFIPMQISQGSQDHIIHPQITLIERDGKPVFKREASTQNVERQGQDDA